MSSEFEYEYEDVEDDGEFSMEIADAAPAAAETTHPTAQGAVAEDSRAVVSDNEESYYTTDDEDEVYEIEGSSSSGGSSTSRDCNSSIPGEETKPESASDQAEDNEGEDQEDEAEGEDDNAAGAFYLTLTDFNTMDEVSSLENSQNEEDLYGDPSTADGDVSYIVEEVLYDKPASGKGNAATAAAANSGTNDDEFFDEEIIELPSPSANASGTDKSDQWHQMHQSADWTFDNEADNDFMELEEVEGFFETYEELLEESGGDDVEEIVIDDDDDDDYEDDEDEEEAGEEEETFITAKQGSDDHGSSDADDSEDNGEDEDSDDEDEDEDEDEGSENDEVHGDDEPSATDATKISVGQDTAPTVATSATVIAPPTSVSKTRSKSKKSSKASKKEKGSSKARGKSRSSAKARKKDKSSSKKKKKKKSGSSKSKSKSSDSKKYKKKRPGRKKRSKPIFHKRQRRRLAEEDLSRHPLDAEPPVGTQLHISSSSEAVPHAAVSAPFKETPETDDDDVYGDDVPVFTGRIEELRQLRQSVTRISAPQPSNAEVAYISGPAGVGKTALAEQLFMHLPAQVVFCYGCFDEAKEKSRAFSGLISSLTMLVDSLQSDYEVDEWRRRLNQSLGKNASLLTRIVPNLGTLLGIDGKADKVIQGFDITTQRRYDRLRFTLRAFLVTVCSHVPVVMVLDDVHCAGDDSLRMMETFLTTKAMKNFMLVCCHRAVKSTHSLSIFKNRLRAMPSCKIILKNLSESSTTNLVALRLQNAFPSAKIVEEVVATDCGGIIDGSTGHAESGVNDVKINPKVKLQLETLSQCLFQKTSGNALLLAQTVHYLVQKDMITWKNSSKRNATLRYELDAIRDESNVPTTTTKVVELRLKGIPKKCALVLKSAALLGLSQFNVDVLLHFTIPIFGITRRKGEDSSTTTVTKETLSSLLETCEENHFLKRLSDTAFAFSHDAIKKCANALFPLAPRTKMLLHFRLGSALSKLGLASSGNSLDDQEMFKLLAADQLNQAVSLANNPKDRAQLSKLNMDLSDLAMNKGAFLEALYKVDAALELLDETAMWDETYELTLRLMLSKARLMFCTRMAPSETIQVAETIIARAANERDRLGAYQVLIFDMMERNLLNGAHAKTIDVLATLDESMPVDLPSAVSQEMQSVEGMIREMTNAQLCTLPQMTHRKTISKMSFLAILAEISRIRGDVPFETICATRMIKLTAQYGSCHVTALAYSLYAIALRRHNIIRVAFRFGRLAEVLAKPETLHGSNALANYHWEVSHIKRPSSTALEVMYRVANFSFDIASTEQLAYHLGTYLCNAMISGNHSLQTAELLSVRFQQFMFDWRVKESWRVFVPYQLLLDLMGNAEDFAVEYEQRVRRWNDTGNARALQYLNFVRLLSEFIFNDYLEAGTMKRRLIGWRPDGVWRPFLALVDCMLALFQAKRSNGKEQQRHFDRANVILQHVIRLASEGCSNCASIAKLLEAEYELTRNKKGLSAMKVRSMYDPAIALAAKHNLLFQQALGNELAGRFFISVQDEAWAAAYLTEAWYLYDQWGASGKCDQLEDEFGTYLDCNFPPRLPDQGQPRRTRRPRVYRTDPNVPNHPMLPPPPVPIGVQVGLTGTEPGTPEQQQQQQQALPAGRLSMGASPGPSMLPNSGITPDISPGAQPNAAFGMPPEKSLGTGSGWMLQGQRPSVNSPMQPGTMPGGPGRGMGGRGFPGRGLPPRKKSHYALRPTAPGLLINAPARQPSMAQLKRQSFRDLAMNAQKKGRSHRMRKSEASTKSDGPSALGGLGDLSKKLNGMKRKEKKKKKSRWRKGKKKIDKETAATTKVDDMPAGGKSPKVRQGGARGLFPGRRRAMSNEDFPPPFGGDGPEAPPTIKPISWRGPSAAGPNAGPTVEPGPQSPRRSGMSQQSDEDQTGQQKPASSRLSMFRKAMPWQSKGGGSGDGGSGEGTKKRGKKKALKSDGYGSIGDGDNPHDRSLSDTTFDDGTNTVDDEAVPEESKKPKTLRQKLLGSGKKKKNIDKPASAKELSPTRRGRKKVSAKGAAGESSDLHGLSMSLGDLEFDLGDDSNQDKKNASFSDIDMLGAASLDSTDDDNVNTEDEKRKKTRKKKKGRRASVAG